MTLTQYILAGIFGVSLAAGQMLFKVAAIQTGPDGAPLSLLQILFTVPTITAVTLYGLTTILYIYLLQQVPLSRAYMFSLAGAALVPILAVLIFREPVNPRYIVGGVLVLIGVALSSSA